MSIKRRFWWLSGLLLLLICGGLIFSAYWFSWAKTGFLSKSLWDWMQLLIVPTVLAVIAFLFSLATSRNEQNVVEQRYQHDLELAADKQREDLLQVYLDRISELLLVHHLRTSDPKDEVRNIARARTLTILSQLDAKRKKSVLQFLFDSDLISKDKSIIPLRSADLRNADLSDIDLGSADLRGADLSGANLSSADLLSADLLGANLCGTNLCDTNLCSSNLSGANLRGANLRGANLLFTDLFGADLRGADLRGANLRDAQLEFANFLGATLDNVSTFDDKISQKESNQVISKPNKLFI